MIHVISSLLGLASRSEPRETGETQNGSLGEDFEPATATVTTAAPSADAEPTSTVTGRPTEGTTNGDDADADALVSAFLDRLESGDLTVDQQARLRETLTFARPTHEDVRIRHLQAQVADLSAYADALEAFLDEEGTAAEITGSFRQDLAALEDRLDALDDRLERMERRLDRFDDRLDGHGSALDGSVRSLRRDLDALAEVAEEGRVFREKFTEALVDEPDGEPEDRSPDGAAAESGPAD